LNFSFVRGIYQGFKTKVYAYDFSGLGKWNRFVSFTRETDIPLSGSVPENGASFNGSKNRPMKHNGNPSDFGQVQSRISKMQIKPGLFIGHGVIPAIAFKSWVAGFKSLLTSTEKGFVGKIDTFLAILKDLGVDVSKVWFLFEPVGKDFMQVIES